MRINFLLMGPGSSSLTEHVSLELQQLSHEGEVGGDDLTSLLHEVKGLVQLDALRVHEVGQTDGCRAGDTCLAMHQYPTTTLFHRVCRRTRRGEEERSAWKCFISTKIKKNTDQIYQNAVIIHHKLHKVNGSKEAKMNKRISVSSAACATVVL